MAEMKIQGARGYQCRMQNEECSMDEKYGKFCGDNLQVPETAFTGETEGKRWGTETDQSLCEQHND